MGASARTGYVRPVHYDTYHMKKLTIYPTSLALRQWQAREAEQKGFCDSRGHVSIRMLMEACAGSAREKGFRAAGDKALSPVKGLGGDAAVRVASDAVQVLGGYGYMRDYPVEKMMRDAKILQIYEGTNQIQRNVIGAALIKEYAKKK